MKKLLALLLCVMLFVGVVPTAAFADTLEEKMAGLYDKVYGYNPTGEESLLMAYGELGGAHAGKTLVNSGEAMAKLIDAAQILADLEAAQAAAQAAGRTDVDYSAAISALEEVIGMVSNPGAKSGFFGASVFAGYFNPLSYNGLFSTVVSAPLNLGDYPLGEFFYLFRDLFGTGVMANTELAGDTVVADAEAEADKLEAQVLADTAAVQNAMQMTAGALYQNMP